MSHIDQTLDYFNRMYNLFGEMAVIENNQIRMEKEIKEPVKEVQERTDKQIQEELEEKRRFLQNHTDDDYDEWFQEGVGR